MYSYIYIHVYFVYVNPSLHHSNRDLQKSYKIHWFFFITITYKHTDKYIPGMKFIFIYLYIYIYVHVYFVYINTSLHRSNRDLQKSFKIYIYIYVCKCNTYYSKNVDDDYSNDNNNTNKWQYTVKLPPYTDLIEISKIRSKFHTDFHPYSPY
jgi:hypothetical protein